MTACNLHKKKKWFDGALSNIYVGIAICSDLHIMNVLTHKLVKHGVGGVLLSVRAGLSFTT